MEIENIIFYNLFVGGILKVFDYRKMTAQEILDNMNSSRSNFELKVTLKKSTSFQDLLIVRKKEMLKYTKPISTDTTCNCISDNPMEYELPA